MGDNSLKREAITISCPKPKMLDNKPTITYVDSRELWRLKFGDKPGDSQFPRFVAAQRK